MVKIYPLFRGRLMVLFLTTTMLLTLMVSKSSWADTINVNTTDDELNVDGDCSLREALRSANLNIPVDACTKGSGDDIIILPSGTYTLTIPADGTPDDGADGDLDISGNLTLSGAGASSTIIDAAGLDRILHLCPSPCTAANLTINNLTLTNGNAGSGNGGAIFNDGSGLLTINSSVISNNKAPNGGGISSESTEGTVVLDSSISGNEASGTGGGGLFITNGDLAILRTTLNDNSTTGQGGALRFSAATNHFDLINCTVSGNDASQGGGLFQSTGAPIISSLENSTLHQNSAAQGSNIFNTAGTLQFTNTIVSDGLLSNNCTNSGTLTSVGNNIDSGNSCGFSDPPDLINTDPLLGPLQDNGGPTLTHAPLVGSPAIDGGNNGDCPSPDQRGVERPQDGNGDGTITCDIGAIELSCGNDILEANEECDDGNLTAGDGCSITCTNEVAPACGDGILQVGEECDDGNLTAGDGCDSTCITELSVSGGGCSLLRI